MEANNMKALSEALEAIEELSQDAREKHPYFCDRLLPYEDYTEQQRREIILGNLSLVRHRIEAGVRDRYLMWNELADCEVWEATEALANGDNAQAVEELYDVIAVLLRTIDVLEGRQKLGRPETISGNDAGK